MTGRVALVTGAARGIGAATVHRLVATGHRVVAVDACEGEDGWPYPLGTERELQAMTTLGDGEQVIAHVADVRDRDALGDAVRRAVTTWGRLDAAVAAAAVVAGGQPLWETERSDVDRLWDIDVKGVWNTAAECVPAMLRSPDPAGARFVAISSAAGSHGLHHLAAYSAAKHAVVGLVKGLAADLVGTGATACAVSPGSTRTSMLSATAALYDMPGVEGFADNQLVRRLLDPDEVAAAVVFCCSREGMVVNGSVVHADGGFAP